MFSKNTGRIPVNNVTCGALIKKLRKEHNLTQTQLADMLSISQTPISRWENGDREISIYMIEKIAKVFGMTLSEFVAALESDPAEDHTEVVVVEDIPSRLQEILSVVKEGLQDKKNLNVNGFSSYERAVAYCEINHVDIVFLDIEPEGKNDGFELAGEIKRMHPYCIVIVVTGHPEYAARAWELHSDRLINGFILKPLTVGRLKKEVSVLKTI